MKSRFNTLKVFSHQETGNHLTYQRDIKLKKFFNQNLIQWNEYQSNMVIRSLKNRNSWDAMWIKEAKKEIISSIQLKNQLRHVEHNYELPHDLYLKLQNDNHLFQIGGQSHALNKVEDFLSSKIEGYWGAISYPEKSRYFCSMISPYLSYGNISIRQIYQMCEKYRGKVRNKKSLDQFQARLKWHCHFVQKLEMEPQMEFQNLNRTFNGIRQKKDKKFLKAWASGQTGYPLIDAAMRCVQETGYLNFRLRASVVSFFTHILWQPWQAGSGHLARMFLDYDPGIHFAQLQMQAGTTGINTIRIYNPIKQSKEKDKDATFIKKWVPELKDLPVKFIHEPWEMTQMDCLLYSFVLGEDYPRPIVDFKMAYKRAQDDLWKIKKSQANKMTSQSIIKKHVSRKRRTRG